MLPAGQIPRPDFPRFGLTQYADRYPSRPRDRSLSVKLPGADALLFADAIDGLPRTTVVADFHCVTTWSRVGLRWGGVRFSDFVRLRVAPMEGFPDAFLGVILRAQDGYRTSLWRDDLMADDVLLADELDGAPLSIDHGAPFRLVAPRQYGYKSLKHLKTIEFCAQTPRIHKGMSSFLDHPRARVALEERGRWFPGWLLRYLYRPFIPRTVARFREGLARFERSGSGAAAGD
jgi:hypothetical protein